MAFEKKITVGDREVTVFELTVGQVRDMAKAASSETNDPLSSWLVEDYPLPVLVAMSSVKEAELEDWRPSEIKQLGAACEEVNPDFFGMDRRLKEMVETIRSVDLMKQS